MDKISHCSFPTPRTSIQTSTKPIIQKITHYHPPPFLDPKWTNIYYEDKVSHEYFWFEDPVSIFKSCHIIPTVTMTDSQRLNILTRIVVIISVTAFVLGSWGWWIILTVGLVTVLLLWFVSKSQEVLCQHLKPKSSPIITYGPSYPLYS
jgi:hypothetical protein